MIDYNEIHARAAQQVISGRLFTLLMQNVIAALAVNKDFNSTAADKEIASSYIDCISTISKQANMQDNEHLTWFDSVKILQSAPLYDRAATQLYTANL